MKNEIIKLAWGAILVSTVGFVGTLEADPHPRIEVYALWILISILVLALITIAEDEIKKNKSLRKALDATYMHDVHVPKQSVREMDKLNSYVKRKDKQ